MRWVDAGCMLTGRVSDKDEPLPCLVGIATYSYHKYHKSVHGEADSHRASPGREDDGFVPLVGAEDGALGDADERRHHREDREMYVLGDEDEEEADGEHGGRASTSSGRRKAKASDDFDEALLRRTR
jgi:hypothetical protein